MHGLDTYDYGARQYDPARITWDRMDQLCEKYYHINPYVYCAGNPVKYIDFEGKEKIIALNPEHPGNRNIIKAAKSFVDDKNTINIWAHGKNEGMTVDSYNAKTGEWSSCNITSASQMEHFLETNSAIYRNRNPGQEITVVLHSCETAQPGKDGNCLAKEISKGLKNVIIIAPTEKVLTEKNGAKEIGTAKSKVEKGNINIDYNNPGKWVFLKNGKSIKEAYSDHISPGIPKPIPGSAEYSNNHNAFLIFLKFVLNYLSNQK